VIVKGGLDVEILRSGSALIVEVVKEIETEIQIVKKGG